MFKITDSKGFHIRFDNGYTVSVQFGPGNYGSNYDMSYFAFKEDKDRTLPHAYSAETAIMDPLGNFVYYKGDDVQGYQTAVDVLETLNYAASL